jgi:hypothetical protein
VLSSPEIAGRVVKKILCALWLRVTNNTTMDFKQVDALASQEPPLPYLVIGGYAVVAHGFVRTTVDIDLLICREDREEWESRTAKAGLSIFHQTNAFIQLGCEDDQIGLDLMIVGKSTFDPMYQESQPNTIEDVSVRVPCLDHLLALKLHAAKNAKGLRISKDLQDIEMLARKNQLALNNEHYRALFNKYGTEDIYQVVIRSLNNEQ